ncbi:hypothetical protein CWC16_19420, partial [Pseudoalteromonas sp. S3776]
DTHSNLTSKTVLLDLLFFTQRLSLFLSLFIKHSLNKTLPLLNLNYTHKNNCMLQFQLIS